METAEAYLGSARNGSKGEGGSVRRILIAWVAVVLLAAVLGSAGCNTWHGFGRDVEDVGRAMQGR